MASDEETLVAQVRQRQPQAMAEFFQSRRVPLLAYVQRSMGQGLRRKIDPEDILQEVGIDCIRSLGKVDLADRDPFSWLCQLAERRIIDAHRKFFDIQKRDAALEVPLGSPASQSGQGGLIEMLSASITSPSKAFSRNERERRLGQALEQLPELTREALRLRYVEGLASKEIAERLGKTDGAIRVMLTRAVKRLEELLGSP